MRTYPHGPLTPLAGNLWLVTARTSQGPIDRKMTVVRGGDGGLYLHDALWLDDPTFAQLDALGPVRTAFVPSWLHDFDGRRFAARYPAARLCAMPSTLRRLRWPELVQFEPGFVPPEIDVRVVPGLRMHESVWDVRHPEGGSTVIFTDALFNIPHVPGIRGLLLRALDSTGPLHMSRLGRMFLLRDRGAFRAYLAMLAARGDVRHVIVGHGRLISGDAAAQLAAAAARV